MSKKTITEEQELQIRRQTDELLRGVLCGATDFHLASSTLQKLIAGERKYDLAEERRVWFEQWYKSLRLKLDIAVPKPQVSNREMRWKQDEGFALFYRPPTSAAPYPWLMAEICQGHHWTEIPEERDIRELKFPPGWKPDDGHPLIVWEPTDTGYWFWAEIAETCPRLGEADHTGPGGWSEYQTANEKRRRQRRLQLLAQVGLPSIEEYIIIWGAWYREKEIRLDITTGTYLRTNIRIPDDKVVAAKWGALNLYGCCNHLHLGEKPWELSDPKPTIEKEKTTSPSSYRRLDGDGIGGRKTFGLGLKLTKEETITEALKYLNG